VHERQPQVPLGAAALVVVSWEAPFPPRGFPATISSSPPHVSGVIYMVRPFCLNGPTFARSKSPLQRRCPGHIRLSVSAATHLNCIFKGTGALNRKTGRITQTFTIKVSRESLRNNIVTALVAFNSVAATKEIYASEATDLARRSSSHLHRSQMRGP
jgi:hypothetical protein